MMPLTNKSAFMGGFSLDQEDKTLISLGHSTPGLKMNGYDAPNMPYTLRNFTDEGWGTKITVDFEKNPEHRVTLLNINVPVTKMIVAAGDIVRTAGVDVPGCSFSAKIKFYDSKEFMHLQREFGQHAVMVFGDYVMDVKQLGGMLKMEVINAR